MYLLQEEIKKTIKQDKTQMMGEKQKLNIVVVYKHLVSKERLVEKSSASWEVPQQPEPITEDHLI